MVTCCMARRYSMYSKPIKYGGRLRRSFTSNVRLRMQFVKLISMLLSSMLLLTACDFQKEADQKFGDQNFKTTVALIELQKIRYGEYPASLKDIRYSGDWDAIGVNSVEYKRVAGGYELNIKRGWVGEPTLSYPPDFWQGLGIVSTNVGGLPSKNPPDKSLKIVQ